MRDDAKYIEKIEMRQYRFFRHIDIKCSKSDGSINQWTVLMGNNDSGKTGILRALAGLNCRKVNPSGDRYLYMPWGVDDNPQKSTEVRSWITNYREWRYCQNYDYVSCTQAEISELEDFRIFGYGVSRFPSQKALTESIEGDCASLSFHISLINFEEWIVKMFTSMKNGNSQAIKQFSILYSVICRMGLFPNVSDLKVLTDDDYNITVLFKTQDDWYKFSDLPSGYQTMLSWVADFCYRMFVRYKDSENPLHEPAIVLIDEIDLNLHPEWQRKIVPLLSEAFPNTQFIATTHSPFVIQSMEDVNLYVLSRDENGRGVISRVPGNNFTGWSVEEILTDIMGLDERINSDKYNELMAKFDDGLDNDDKQKVEEAYSALCAILPPNSKTRKIIDYQKKKVS